MHKRGVEKLQQFVSKISNNTVPVVTRKPGWKKIPLFLNSLHLSTYWICSGEATALPSWCLKININSSISFIFWLNA